jgi:non-ribosomal peptide synthase protein (TIGR01720 family)
VNISRTVGWFTCMYPQRLQLEGIAAGAVITQVKEQMNATPGNGVGYGLCQYPRKAGTPGKSLSEIRFNYLGQFDETFNNDLFTYCSEGSGISISPENEMTAKIEINVIAVNGTLEIAIQYNSLAHHSSTIQVFANSLVNWLVRISQAEPVPGPGILDDDELAVLFN